MSSSQTAFLNQESVSLPKQGDYQDDFSKLSSAVASPCTFTHPNTLPGGQGHLSVLPVALTPILYLEKCWIPGMAGY